MIESLKNDDVFLTLYDGEKGDSVEKELIVTGELAGVPFKGKIDTINHSQGYFVDLKTMKSVRGKEWSNTLGQYTANVIANIFDYATPCKCISIMSCCYSKRATSSLPIFLL